MAPQPALGGDPATITTNTATRTRSWPSHTFTCSPTPTNDQLPKGTVDARYIATVTILLLVVIFRTILFTGRSIMLRRAFQRRMIDALTQGRVVDPETLEYATPYMTEVHLDAEKVTSGDDGWRSMKPLSAVVLDYHWRGPEVLLLTREVMLRYRRMHFASGYYIRDAIISWYRRLRASITTERSADGQSSSPTSANKVPQNPFQTDRPDETEPSSAADPISSAPVLGVTWIIAMPNANRPTYTPASSLLSAHDELPEIMLAVKEVDWIRTRATSPKCVMGREVALSILRRNTDRMHAQEYPAVWSSL